jgi:hypothetical protein
MLEDTRVICSGEFNRTPKVGRDHHHDGFSLWMAGGGVRAGPMHGVTDELGIGLAEGKVYVHDLHATLVHLPYFQYKPPTYRYARRDFQLSDVEGEIVRKILA